MRSPISATATFVPALVLGTALFLAPRAARAADVTLTWTANAEADLAGYKMYYDVDAPGTPYTGTDATEGPSPILVPLASLKDPGNPQLTMHGFTPCKHYYFAVSAYDSSSNESPPSVEATLPLLLPSVEPLTATVESPTSILVKWLGLGPVDGGTLVKYRVHWDIDRGRPYGAVGSPHDIPPAMPDPIHPSLLLQSLAPNTRYYIAVESACPDETSKFSDETSANTGAPNEGPIGPGPGPDGGPLGSEGGPDGEAPGGSSGDSGCGCRVSESAHGVSAAFLLSGVAALALSWRRRGSKGRR